MTDFRLLASFGPSRFEMPRGNDWRGSMSIAGCDFYLNPLTGAVEYG